VDNEETFRGIALALNALSEDVPIIFPAHPRTSKQMETFGITLSDRIHVLPPLSFRESLFLWKDALLVMTDSGGLQEETTTALGIPCFTVREHTERPITVEEGTNTIVGASGAGILKAWQDFSAGKRKTGSVPELWDGHAAERIVEILCRART
jgi:UDP-N-acetylglucosamine 2-epimerase (non-hydrolysing)